MSPATHDLVSIQLLQPLRRLSRLARPALRPAALACREGLSLREQVAGWPTEQRREWMLARLREAVRRAWWTTRYYRELFDQIGFDPRSDFTFDDFAALPTLEREEIHRAGRALVSVAVPSADLRYRGPMTAYLTRPDKPALAYRYRPGRGLSSP